jgi:hypothetical protein
MVPVPVGIDAIAGIDLVFIHHLNDSFIFSAGINDHPIFCFRAGHNIGVDDKVPDIQAKINITLSMRPPPPVCF